MKLNRSTPSERGRHKCHSVALSGQLAQMPHLWHFGRPPDTNFMPHCDMLIRYEMSQCHTFQLRKNVFSYEMCDIVTSVPPPQYHPEPAEGPCHPEPAEGPCHPELAEGPCHPEPAEGPCHPELAEGPCHPEPAEGPCHPEPAEGPCHPELAEGPCHPELAEGPCHPEPAEGSSRLTPTRCRDILPLRDTSPRNQPE